MLPTWTSNRSSMASSSCLPGPMCLSEKSSCFGKIVSRAPLAELQLSRVMLRLCSPERGNGICWFPVCLSSCSPPPPSTLVLQGWHWLLNFTRRFWRSSRLLSFENLCIFTPKPSFASAHTEIWMLPRPSTRFSALKRPTKWTPPLSKISCTRRR